MNSTTENLNKESDKTSNIENKKNIEENVEFEGWTKKFRDGGRKKSKQKI